MHANHDGSGSYSETFNVTARRRRGRDNGYFIA